MGSETTEEHKKASSNNITCGIITLSDSKSYDTDLSGKYLEDEISKKYYFKKRIVIPDESICLIQKINEMIDENIDVILTTGGTGISSRDITVETVECLFEKKLDGFGEIFRRKSYDEIGVGSLISRATAGVYKKTVLISLPGSPNAVETGLKIIIDELPHIVYHTKK